MIRYLVIITCLYFLGGCQNKGGAGKSWTLVMHQEGKPDIEVVALPNDLSKDYHFHKTIDGITVELVMTPNDSYTVFKASAYAVNKGKRAIFLSLKNTYAKAIPFNFNGEVTTSEIYRQSPHDVNAWIVKDIAEQAVPVVALKDEAGFEVAVCGSPYLYENYTSQAYSIDQKYVALRSGDDGKTPGLRPTSDKNLEMDYNADKSQVFSPGKIESYYHTITNDRAHSFEGILFRSNAASTKGLRKDVNQLVAKHFSVNSFDDYFGSLAFSTAYMNLRKNETKKSAVWVVPSVEYGNTQYCRDAFWISMMLEPKLSKECLLNELTHVNHYAEYPLFALLWAYRLHLKGETIDKAKLQDYVNAIEDRVRNHFYYSYLESDGRLDFQYWGDIIAFEKDDIVSYNQGLLAVALRAAKMMDLNVRSDYRKASENYRNMFNKSAGYFPISLKKKDITGPDPVVGDLLSQLYFGEALLDDAVIRSHYNTVTRYLKTPYGFKAVSSPDGQYLKSEQYDVPGYQAQVNREGYLDGSYFRGGSYFLYDNLFLINAYLHGIKEAEKQLIWRVSMDFTIGNTTYETLNTKTGEPWKPNMGWNVAIYAIWKDLIEKEKATDSLFDSVDSIANHNLHKK